jgi:hypothetical protein
MMIVTSEVLGDQIFIKHFKVKKCIKQLDQGRDLGARAGW